MSEKKKSLWIVGMLSLYTVIAIVGFIIAYFVKTTFFTKASVATPKHSLVKKMLVPTPTGWKTYENQDYNVKLSYSPEDSIKQATYGFGIISIALQNKKDSQQNFHILLLPKSLAQAAGQDFDTYYAMPNNMTKTIMSPLAKDHTSEKFTKIRNRSVDGFQALDYQSLPSTATPGTKPEIGTFIENGDNLILISTEASNKNTLEQMLRTVQSL